MSKNSLGEKTQEFLNSISLSNSKTIEQTLSERAGRYGDFKELCFIAQSLKCTFHDSPNWNKLSDDKKEILEMIAHKIARILNGDHNYHDNWHDIVGYAKLIADDLISE